jgi:hypothetical protein
MKDEKANVTLLHPFKPSVDIFLPQSQSINYRSILMLKRNRKILFFAPTQQQQSKTKKMGLFFF